MIKALAIAAVTLVSAQAETQREFNCKMVERTNGYAWGAIKAAEISIEAAKKVCKKKGSGSQACKAAWEISEAIGDFAKQADEIAKGADEVCKKS